MNALALVIGNADYILPHHKLVNAVNDATDFSSKLMNLGFTVQKVTDCTEQEFDAAIRKFGDDLKNYEVGLFYFSGHGLQINGINYLTATNTSFVDESSAKFSSINLNEIIERMQIADPIVKVMILDACRDNPLAGNFRGIQNLGLAPINAPKGTIIAFSTSPGEKAQDYGAGRNSIYTGSLLKHIDSPNLPIEDFFKKVRTSVYHLSAGKQTSWEHTSLIGNFYFNSGQLVHSVEVPYEREVIADHLFVSTGSEVDKIIEKLRTHDWYDQAPAIQKLRSIDVSTLTDSDLFLLGRNILQTASGNEFSAQAIMKDLSNRLPKFQRDEENHVLNGMLYEMYFDSKGLFRTEGFKSDYVNELYALEINVNYKASFDFISRQLANFSEYLYYLPFDPPRPLALEAILEKYKYTPILEDEETDGYRLISVKHETSEILFIDPNKRNHNDEITIEKFKEKLTDLLCVPNNRLVVSFNFPETEVKFICVPWPLRFKRQASK